MAQEGPANNKQASTPQRLVTALTAIALAVSLSIRYTVVVDTGVETVATVVELAATKGLVVSLASRPRSRFGYQASAVVSEGFLMIGDRTCNATMGH